MSQNANNSKGQTKVSSTKASTNNNTLDKTQTAASLQPIAAEKLKVRKKKESKKELIIDIIIANIRSNSFSEFIIKSK